MAKIYEFDGDRIINTNTGRTVCQFFNKREIDFADSDIYGARIAELLNGNGITNEPVEIVGLGLFADDRAYEEFVWTHDNNAVRRIKNTADALKESGLADVELFEVYRAKTSGDHSDD